MRPCAAGSIARGSGASFSLEVPELRSLRPAKRGELLSQRQIFEREVSAGSERRTERAQQSEYEGHCLLARMPLGHRPGFWQTTGPSIGAKSRDRYDILRIV